MKFPRIGALAAAIIMLGGCASTGEAQTKPLNPATPADSLTIGRKVQCSTVDNAPVIYWWHGVAYSRRQGEKDVHLFDVEGMNIRACSSITDEKGTKGYHLVSRELLLYRDKETGEVLKTWDNPWTGETVDVLQVANDPVNFKAFETDREGSPSIWGGEIMANQWWYRSTFPLWYPNPLGGDFQKEVGATYHATEMFDFFGSTDDLLDPKTETAQVWVGWTRMSDWLPWMEMNGREGLMYMHTAGKKLSGPEELPESMKAEIAANYPEYTSPPPAGDPRANMTSWKYFKAVRDGTIEAPKR